MLRTLRLLPILVALLLPAATAHSQKKANTNGGPRPGNKDESAVAIVNGQKIPLKRYTDLYNDQSSHQIRLGQGPEVDQMIDDQLLLQLVEGELLRQEAAKRKISITRDQAVKALLANPPDFIREPFTDPQGTFQKETFRQVVQNPELVAQLVDPGANKAQIVKQWKEDLEKVILFMQDQELKRLLKESLYKEKPLTPAQIRNRYFAERTRFTGSFIRVLHSTVPDSLVPVTDEEARRWYDTHLDDYKFSSARQIGSMIIPIRPLPADSAAQRARISAAREAVMNAPMEARPRIVQEVSRELPPNRFPESRAINLIQIPQYAREALRKAKPGELIGPFAIDKEDVLLFIEDTVATRDTVLHARHVLLKVDPEDPESETTARTLISMLKENIKTEEHFQQAIQFYSQDGSAKRGGDLGFFGRGSMVREFDSAAFSAPVGEVIGPVRTAFGYHLIKVDERVATAYKIRELRFPFIPSAAAFAAARADAEIYARALRDGTVTDSLYYELKGKYPGTVADTSIIRRLEIYGDAIAPANFAFDAERGDVGVLTLPFDRLMIAQVLFAWPTSVAPYENIRENYVIPHVRRAKQLDALKPTMTRLRDTLTADMTVGIMRLTAPMAESFMIQNQFLTSPPDEDTTLLDSLVEITGDSSVSGPVRGTHGYYFLRVLNKKSPPTDADFRREREIFTRDYAERYRERLLNQTLAKAREYAVVEDRRPSSLALQRQQ